MHEIRSKARRRRPRALFVVGCVVGLAGCSAVLGLDAPKHDPCFHGCVDGSATGVDARAAGDGPAPSYADGADSPGSSGGDASSDGGDVTRDGAPPTGVRCGGGAFPVVYCAGSTPACCQLPGGAAGATYACRASMSACEGYAIECASDDDCAGSNICCHFASAIKCEKPSVCSDEAIVCEPGAPNDCPGSWKCSVSHVNASVTSPYHGCSP